MIRSVLTGLRGRLQGSRGSLFRNIGVVFFGNTAASFVGIVSFTLLSRMIGPEELGLLVMAQAYVMIVSAICNVQTWESTVRDGAGAAGGRELPNVVGVNSLIDIASAVVGMAASMLLARTFVHSLGWDPRVVPLIQVLSVGIAFNLSTLTVGVPRLFDKFSSVSRAMIIGEFVKLGGVALLYALDGSLLVAAAVYLASDVVKSLIVIGYSLGLLRQRSVHLFRKEILYLDSGRMWFIWWTNLRTIVRIPVRHLDVVVIGSVMQPVFVGVFKVYKEIAGLFGRVGDPINQAIYPEYSKLVGCGEAHEARKLARETVFLLLPVSLAAGLPLLFASATIVSTFFGKAFLVDVDVLYYLVIIQAISFVTVPLDSLFIAAGFAKTSFLLVLFTNVTYLVLSLVLGKTIAVYGVLIANASQLVLNKGLKVYFMRKYPDNWATARR